MLRVKTASLFPPYRLYEPTNEPTSIEMHTLKAYGGIAAEHVYSLLGDVALATKAEQMSERLYNSRSADRRSEARRRLPGAPTSP